MLTHLKATTKELFSQPSLKGTRAECVTQKEICGSCSSRRRPRVRDCGFLVETAAIANRSPGRARMGGKNAPRPPSTRFLTSHSYFPLAQPKSKKADSKPAELRFLEGKEVRRDERWVWKSKQMIPTRERQHSWDLLESLPGSDGCKAWIWGRS